MEMTLVCLDSLIYSSYEDLWLILKCIIVYDHMYRVWTTFDNEIKCIIEYDHVYRVWTTFDNKIENLSFETRMSQLAFLKFHALRINIEMTSIYIYNILFFGSE